MSKLEATTGSLWKAKIKIAKKTISQKIFSPALFEINTSNFQEMFFAILRKIYQKEVF